MAKHMGVVFVMIVRSHASSMLFLLWLVRLFGMDKIRVRTALPPSTANIKPRISSPCRKPFGDTSSTAKRIWLSVQPQPSSLRQAKGMRLRQWRPKTS